MSRSGYTDDYTDDPLALGRWRQAVDRALYGKRGQAFLKEMLAALDAMPNKRLITDDLQNAAGDVCAIGAVGKARGQCSGMAAFEVNHDYDEYGDIEAIDNEGLADFFGIAPAMAREIQYTNDEFWKPETPEQRWERVRRWVVRNIKADA